MINRLVRYFTNKGSLAETASESFHVNILLGSCITSIFLIFPFLIYWGYQTQLQSPQFALLFVLTVALVCTPFLYRSTGSVPVSGLFINAISILVLIVFTWIDGGLYSTALVWYPILPLFAGFYAGLRYAFMATAVLLSSLVVMYFSHQAGLVPEPRITGFTQMLMYFGSALAVTILALVITQNFVRWSEAVQNELIQANEAKNEFLSGISHELRTPLNSILGFSEVLNEGYAGELSEKQSRYADHIHSSGKHLLTLVDDLLDITKIEAGSMALQPHPVDVPELVSSSLEMLRGSALKKEIEMQTEVAGDLQDNSIVLDEIKVRQVLINLIGNAIKFSPNASVITLRAAINDEKLVLEVIDSGPGVPEKYHQSVFERFFQLHSDSDNKEPGTGLGLTICKHFVDMHGGYIYLKESLKGAHVVCELPTTLDPAPVA